MCSSSLWYMIHVILMLPSSSQYSFWKYTIWPLQTFLWTISFFFASAISEWWKCKHIFKGKLLFLVGCQGFLSSIFVAFLASLLSFTQIVSSEMNITFISIEEPPNTLKGYITNIINSLDIIFVIPNSHSHWIPLGSYSSDIENSPYSSASLWSLTIFISRKLVTSESLIIAFAHRRVTSSLPLVNSIKFIIISLYPGIA